MSCSSSPGSSTTFQALPHRRGLFVAGDGDSGSRSGTEPGAALGTRGLRLRVAPMAARFRSVVQVLAASVVLVLAGSAGAQTSAVIDSANEPERVDKGSEKATYAVELMVLHATNTGGGIDKRVGEMPELKKPPFSAYDTYQLLAKTRLPLEVNSPQTYRLPNARILKMELKEPPQKDTCKIAASINQPGGKAFLPLLQVRAGLGQSFIVAGQTYKAGILVLVLKIVKG